MITLTEQEVLEKYGNIELIFESYYKYQFLYSAKLEGSRKICVTFGGNGPDIYRSEFGPKEKLNDQADEDFDVSVYEDSTLIESY